MTDTTTTSATRATLPTWSTSERPMARKLGRPVRRFLHIEAASGVVLLLATIAALLWANLAGDTYVDFWHSEISIDIAGLEVTEDLVHWVNDGLMVVFFFVVGLEIKREWEVGELVDRRAAVLPAAGALGGMIVPALIYLAINAGGEHAGGWGIPMATDIAFALGVLALVGRRVPGPLTVFLLTLAIVDDLGAIAVIAVFYSESIHGGWLALTTFLLALTYVLKRLRVWYMPVYVALGLVTWFAMFESGVHATLAGVVLGIITPTHALNPGVTPDQVEGTIADPSIDDVTSAMEAARLINESVPVGSRLIRALHPWTSFVIVPIFALANAGIELSGDVITDAASSSVTLGIGGGLVVGKIIGILGAVMITVRLGWGRLPVGSTMVQVFGISALAGIGFTVSLFISGLAFDDASTISEAKIGVLAASLIASLVGAAILLKARPDEPGGAT